MSTTPAPPLARGSAALIGVLVASSIGLTAGVALALLSMAAAFVR